MEKDLPSGYLWLFGYLNKVDQLKSLNESDGFN